ncbi:MAG TPA: glycoside hydrolase family 15 protein [Gaiellaceae bacterium]|nr:glycoside hydrolase family 15 protein [Gaiellaceae bacterium]
MGRTTPTPDASSTPPPHILREYALLADGERGAIVGPRGDIGWLCFPSWHSDALCSALIGGEGVYSITPRDRYVWGGSYEPGSLIWRNRWVTDTDCIVETREALALPSRPDRAVLLRQVIAKKGTARVTVRLDPRGGFGSRSLRELSRDDDGTWHGRVGDIRLRWAGGGKAREDDGLVLELELDEGDRHNLVLVLARSKSDTESLDAGSLWAATVSEWEERVPSFEESLAPRDARHAYAVLSGLTSRGGTVAAATTSLPERAREGRNYDYRYVWIRDQCYVGQAAAAAETPPLLDASVALVRERLLEHGAALRPAYTIDGEHVPDEHQLGLPGYPGGYDVAGNHAGSQFQLDAFGEALLLFAAAARDDRLSADDWRAAAVAADAIAERWREPDAGVWELEPDLWTQSRLTCSAGLRAVCAFPAAESHRADWLALADTLVAEASASATHPTGRWQRSPSDERVDAGLLLPLVRGAMPKDDARTRSTLETVERELGDDGYIYRYRIDERPLGAAEGAFLLCGFIVSLAWKQQGDRLAAVRYFERNRAAYGSPGLYAEQYDVGERQLRGNIPQAFVHALLLECAMRV